MRCRSPSDDAEKWRSLQYLSAPLDAGNLLHDLRSHCGDARRSFLESLADIKRVRQTRLPSFAKRCVHFVPPRRRLESATIEYRYASARMEPVGEIPGGANPITFCVPWPWQSRPS